MDRNSFAQVNPWSEDDHSLGTMKNVLRLAAESGHLHKERVLEREDTLEDAKQKFPSMKLMGILKEIEDKRKNIDKLSLEIQQRLQDKETRDLTHLDVLEKRISLINNLNTHLQQIVSQKSQLITRLQQPYVGDFIRIQANYKEFASELIPQIVPILSQLSVQMDNIEWAASANMSHQQWESLLADISTALATLQTNFQNMVRLQTSITQLHQERASIQH